MAGRRTSPDPVHRSGLTVSERPRKADFVKALQDVVAERASRGETYDPDATLDAAADRMGVRLMRSTFEPQGVAGPFPAPDGFHYPLVLPRRATARRKATLISQLEVKRPEARRMAVAFLGRSMEDPLVVAAIWAASVDDPDPYVRGECLTLLGLSTAEAPDTLLAGARHLVGELPLVNAGTRASDLARDGAARGIFGALLGAVRAQRHDLAAELRALTLSLATAMTSDHSTLPARQRASLLKVIDEWVGSAPG